MIVDSTSFSPVWFDSVLTDFERALQFKIEHMAHISMPLHQAMQYGLLGGGKRLRACLVFAAGQVVGVPIENLVDSACAIEAMHAYSLVHDDLPSMDNDTLRRGKPTCHVKFGEAMALLAGDALQTTAFQWLLDSSLLPESVRLRQALELAKASGAQGMANGQAIDLSHVGKSMSLQALREMHACKTGALIQASIRLGYLAQPDASTVVIQQLEVYAQALGLAYQVMDDILDVESTSEELGKTSGKDALANKPTMVSLMGLEPARALLVELRQSALAACRACHLPDSHPLVFLVERITDRKS